MQPFPHHLMRFRRTTEPQQLEYRFWLAVQEMHASNQRDDGATRALWNHLHCPIDTHRRFSAPGETVRADVLPLPRTALQLYAVAMGGVVNARRKPALSSLVSRGIVQEHADTGVVDLRCEALREFIRHDIDHGELDASRKGGGGVWRVVWPPLAIGGVLGLALANPEMPATLLATLVAVLPPALPFLGVWRAAGSTGTQ